MLKRTITDAMGDHASVEIQDAEEMKKRDNDLETDICIVDLMSSRDTARTTITGVRELFPRAGIIAMHIYTTAELVRPLIEQGADGYLTYDPSRKELVGSIREVAAGNKYLPAFIS
ncbi:response regulator transcription factor [Rhodohalobacter mucosus]|uniref:response regulator transcription factor n=1 Tax=Rhodohalobacter mucosus TaxID=2079485 RepID=UPI0011B20A74|nr:response regulator transcription factor [Rhodohalobacter mucosus]